VYDNTDISKPKALGFMQIIGNTDMAIKDNRLYADCLGNLLNLSITNFATVTEKGKLPLQNWNLGVPPPSWNYFECVDPSRGLVASWKKGEIKNDDCYAQ
jgi:hypothetical protein